MSKRIVITGATGLIGKKLVTALLQRKDEIIIFTRNVENAKSFFPSSIKIVKWDYHKPEAWQINLENTDAIIHLAGVNLFAKRWNKKFKDEILKSREVSTKNLVNVIKSCKTKPEVFISASAIGYYGNRGDENLTENSSNGTDFLSNVCKTWEFESTKVEESGIRNVKVRTGIILTPEDGALKQMLLPYKLFAGGPLGGGNQWMSWLHIDDIVKIYVQAIDNKKLTGAVNAAAPNPVRMKEFAHLLGKVLKRPSFFSVPKFALKIVVGEAAEVVTASQRIDVKKLSESGYQFKFTELENALKNLLKK